MTILKIIHGYPPRYSAGSEVYSQTVCRELAHRGHEVHVFTREENPFCPDFRVVTERQDGVWLHIVNNPRSKESFSVPEIDVAVERLLLDIKPDVVHIGHLSHLSMTMVRVIKRFNIPILLTLHDFWLLCPRGQFLKVGTQCNEPYRLCNKRDAKACSRDCYSRYWTGLPECSDADSAHWEKWIQKRTELSCEVLQSVDLIHAPSRQLALRFIAEVPELSGNCFFLDYGFNRRLLQKRVRKSEEKFVFGYIGTHIPAKGINLLLKAFAKVKGARLRIWGRSNGVVTEMLRSLAEGLDVEFMGGYCNDEICKDVFNRCDAIVVPSIWLENSPLVIHEAQGARVPVITADVGGMAEYVKHGENGLLFHHREADDLSRQMQRMVCEDGLAKRLGRRGYLFSRKGLVPSIGQHVGELVHVYESLVMQKKRCLKEASGPWRITFDTNPDLCNRSCIMCERHSAENQRRLEQCGEHLSLMPSRLIESVVAEAVPLGLQEIVPSTMGEPLLYPDFDIFPRLCRKYGLKLNLTTNGSFPGRRSVSQWAKLILPVASDVKVSWNGASKNAYEHIMPGGCGYECSLRNLKDFVKVRDDLAETGGNRCHITLQVTFMKCNFEDLEGIIRMAIELGVDRVKGHHLIVTSPQIRNESILSDGKWHRRWNDLIGKLRRIVAENPMALGRTVELVNFKEISISNAQDRRSGGQCPFLGKEAWISQDGEFSPCCYPDAERRKLGLTKPVAPGGLARIFESKSFRDVMAKFPNNPVCRTCSLRQ